jgi:2,3,4,5-tetrahydropyridine-2,6-dicarboxylate N-acetyltransferase
MNLNNGNEIIAFISNAVKKTPVRATIMMSDIIDVTLDDVKVFQSGKLVILKGEYTVIAEFIDENQSVIVDVDLEYDRRNSAVPLLDTTNINARIEPGAVIRDHVSIGDNAVIMMGALVNIGCQIGSGTMIDMGAVLGGRVIVGNNSHVGAGSVLAGVIEPPSATPVTIGDNVLIGANVVVLEGVKIGDGAVVGAGSIVTSDVEANTVVVGNPARVVKFVDQAILDKTQILDELRKL